METHISDEHMLEFLLSFDGRIHYFDRGYWVKFEFRQVAATPERPHGLRYSLTLHDPDGKRLVGFDNAHGVPAQGARYRKPEVAHDHWHRTSDDEGRPYSYTTALQLLTDFQTEVKRVLAEFGLDDTVIEDGETTERKTP